MTNFVTIMTNFVTSVKPDKQRWLILAILGLHVMGLWGLLAQTYPSGTHLFERYSLVHTIVLLISVIIILWWMIALWRAETITRIINEYLNDRHLYALLAGAGVMTFILQIIPANESIKGFILLTTYSTLAYLIYQYQAAPQLTLHRLQKYAPHIIILLLVLFALQSLLLPASLSIVDEAIWMDYATKTWRGHSTLYPDEFADMFVFPGVGITVPLVLGTLLSNIWFSPYTGRIILIIAHLISSLLIYKTARNLKLPYTGLILTLLLFVTSTNIITAYDYRPHHFLPLVASLTAYLYVQTIHDALNIWQRRLYVTLLGFFAISAIQIHAVGVMYAFVWSTFIALKMVSSWRNKQAKKTFFTLFMPFGFGGVLGLSIFWLFNVQSVGSLENYLAILNLSRGGNTFSALPIILNMGASIYWRIDILLMSLAWCGAIGAFLWGNTISKDFALLFLLTVFYGIFFDSYGYSHVYIIFATLTASLAIAQFARALPQTARSWLLVTFSMGLTAQALGFYASVFTRYNPDDFPLYGQHTQISHTLDVNYLTDDDIMVSSDVLIWSLHHRNNWYGVYSAILYRGYYPDTDPIQQWQDIQPNLVVYIPDVAFHTASNHIGSLWQYLEQESFMICDSFEVDPYEIIIFRKSDEIAANYCPNPQVWR